MNHGKQPGSQPCKFVAEDEAATDELGKRLAAAIQPGMVIGLVGDLGAGKTRLVQSVAESLGIDRSVVSSPTFVLHHEYSGAMTVHHFDAYRLRDSDEFLEIGGAELLDSQAVSFIEWGDRIADVLPRDLLWIKIVVVGPSSRRFVMHGTGPRSEAVLSRLGLS